MNKIKFSALCLIVFYNIFVGVALGEGTRHIKGKNVNLYFMNDKVFGAVGNNPLWAIYNCGNDIKGEMDINGKFYSFNFKYHSNDENIVTGAFGPSKMTLKKIEKSDTKFFYHILINNKESIFSIRYERIEDEHLVNSIIEGKVDPDNKVKLTVDGHLCPFATTGVVLIVAGALTEHKGMQ